jgi:hypothetical protein
METRYHKKQKIYTDMKKIYFSTLSFILIGFMVASCKNEAADPTVTYKVTTQNGNFAILYLDENGEYIQKKISTNDWSTEFNGKVGDSVSISIKANTLNDMIEAKIIYDGKIIKEVVTYGQRSGEHVSAEISTKLPY